MKHPLTPDGRYFVVRGRLWRMANPGLDEEERTDLVGRLMRARRAVRDAKRSADLEAEADAHKTVEEIKRALGERGPVWWDDGSPDFNRHMAMNTAYADWWVMPAIINYGSDPAWVVGYWRKADIRVASDPRDGSGRRRIFHSGKWSVLLFCRQNEMANMFPSALVATSWAGSIGRLIIS